MHHNVQKCLQYQTLRKPVVLLLPCCCFAKITRPYRELHVRLFSRSITKLGLEKLKLKKIKKSKNGAPCTEVNRWPKATSPPQELDVGPRRAPYI